MKRKDLAIGLSMSALLGVAPIALGAYLFQSASRENARIRGVASWPTVTAAVDKIWLVQKAGEPNDVAVFYTYAVGGTTYSSGCISAGAPADLKLRQQLLAAGVDAQLAQQENRIAERAFVTAHYDPENPADSCLEAGEVTTSMRMNQWFRLAPAAFGALFLGWLYAPKRRRTS